MAQFCERRFPISGAMAEYSVYKENTVFPLPANLSLEEGAFWNRQLSPFERWIRPKLILGILSSLPVAVLSAY